MATEKKKRRDSEASRMSDAPKTESTHPADDSQAHETEGTSDSEDEPPLTVRFTLCVGLQPPFQTLFKVL